MCGSFYLESPYVRNEKKSQLAEKLEKFYFETENLRSYLKSEGRYRMRLQIDQEFNQNEIKK